MTTRRRILIAEDDASLRRVSEYELSHAGYEVTAVPDGTTAWKEFRESGADLVVTDLAMPGMDGLELLTRIKRSDPDTEVIVVTAFGTVDRAVEAMKSGAFDFITKPFALEVLKLAAARALEHRGLRGENRRLQAELTDRFSTRTMIGKSASMQRIFDLVGRLAATDTNVLIIGESGTGKELIARAIHHEGPRNTEPFVAVNCGALPRDLLESELFGVTRGAFTGADRDRPGLFEAAGKGTLFFDEITEMPLDLQVKLLRALQEREVVRLGSSETIPVEARFIFATNADIGGLVADRTFRRDLYFRINVATITVPPLRTRRDDLSALVTTFLKRYGAPETLTRDQEFDASLASYSWPGNIRELENAIERAVILRRDPDRLSLSDLPPEIAAAHRNDTGPDGELIRLPDEGLDLYGVEKSLLQQALERAGGNQSQAARLLNLTRQTFLYRLRKYGIS